jgi:signal transduction histidine kinase
MAQQLARVFEQYPAVPGVVIQHGPAFLGMMARQEFLECLLPTQDNARVLQQTVRTLHRYRQSQSLVLSADTPILTAAQHALRRSPDTQDHPIVIQDGDQYFLLSSHDLNIAHWQLRGIETQVRYERAQAKMLQTDKMAALGRLVDGVAHEILEPIGFIWGNLSYISDYSQQLLSLIDAYNAEIPNKPASVQELEAEIELDYLKDDFPRIIKSIQRGAVRLKQLGSSLQNFCHLDDVYPKPADLNDVLDSVVLLLQSHLTTQINITREYGSLPPVSCFAGQLSQALMNLLSDRVDRLLEQTIRHRLAQEIESPSVQIIDRDRSDSPTITITTRLSDRHSPSEGAIADRWVAITLTDNGPGLPPEVESQVRSGFLEELRSMKESSLTISYRIITAKHGGQLSVRSHTFSPENQPLSEASTEFEILLPLYR